MTIYHNVDNTIFMRRVVIKLKKKKHQKHKKKQKNSTLSKPIGNLLQKVRDIKILVYRFEISLW